jgi:hypothetical protein
MITAKKLAFAIWPQFEADEIEAAAAVLLGRAGLPAAPPRAQKRKKGFSPMKTLLPSRTIHDTASSQSDFSLRRS